MAVDLLRQRVDGPSSMAIPQGEAMVYEINLLRFLSQASFGSVVRHVILQPTTRVQFPEFTHDAEWFSPIYFPWGLG